MSMKRLRTLFASTIAVLLLAAVTSILSAKPVAAAGETYTWKDYRTITISGGDVNGSAQLGINSSVQLTGDQEAAYTGFFVYKPDDCQIFITLYTFKTSTLQGYLWAPAGIIPVPPVASGSPQKVDCNNKFNNYNDQLKYHDKWVDLQGTRPKDPNAPEKLEEQIFRVVVNAPDPQSTAPKTDNVYVYTTDGKTKVMQMTLTFQSQNGQAQWPPDQTPMAGTVIFQGLQPGSYVVCDDYVDKVCSSDKAKDEQKITKVKYDGSGSTTLGTLFLTPDKKRIRGHVEYNIKAPCGSTVSVNPMQIELTGPDGKAYDQETNAGTATPSGAENGALCTKEVTVFLYAQWDNMPPGDYKACATGGVQCATFTKPADAGVDDFTIVVNADPQAPPDQKVCTSGDGIAGALAWIICPVVQIIASATDFFENNIIIPFMTISPLTTNGANPIYILWQDFRDLANVGFVVLLFISIFSIALSKYGLKRVLPRLFIVVIGINLSYFIVAFVVDAFNIFGSGISQLVLAALQQANTTQLASGTSAGTVRSIFTLGGAALLAIILTGGAALGWLFSFLGLAALVIVVVVILLVVRQIALIVLVVLSPLAILMYLLPNTEGYFKKWRQMLLQLLMMYPMIVLLFASGKILGVFLQQPDFKITGDGVSDEVAQSVRVILQFLVYIIPLVFLPATFVASGSLMGRAYSFLNNSRLRKAAQQPGKSFHENVVKPKRQELQMHAAQRGGRIGQLAGFNMRRQFKKEQREQELGRAKQEHLARLASDENFAASAAGIGGQSGATRVQGSAVSALEKARKQEIANEAAILSNELRQLGISAKEFNNAFSDFLRNPSNNIVTGRLRNASGTLRTIDLSQRIDLTRSALNSAAAAGEITTMEQARLSSSVNQGMLDDVIRNNEGNLKSKGGYHLTSNFNLANGRSQGTQRDLNIARLRNSFAAGGEDIAGMKASFVNAVRGSLRDPVVRASMTTGPNALTAAELQTVKANINSILSSPDISGGAKNIDALRDIEGML